MKYLPVVALMALFASPTVAQDTPAGASATPCDESSFTAVRSERTGEILYWTNSTCTGPRMGTETMMMGEGMMGGGMMGEGMMGGDMMGGDMSESSM